MHVDKGALRSRIWRAFADVSLPARIEDMRLPRYVGSDSWEMAAAFLGKRWDELPIPVVFYHRESLGTLSAAAYRAYVPAYLAGAFASDDPLDRYGPDLRYYLVSTLAAWPHQSPARAADTRERLSLLDPEQRAAVADVLRVLASSWHMDEAREVLASW